VVLGTSTQGAAAAFVLTTGRPAGAAGTDWAVASGAGAERAAAGRDATQQPTASASALAGAPPPSPPQQHQGQEQRQQQEPSGRDAAAALAAAPNWSGVRLRLWNPLTGQCVPATDPSCELREVGTIYSTANIWANVQATGHPWELDWGLAGPGWRAFFGQALPLRELASVQVGRLTQLGQSGCTGWVCTTLASLCAPRSGAPSPFHPTTSCTQVAPSYDDLDRRVYEELEARVEETVRAALYGEPTARAPAPGGAQPAGFLSPGPLTYLLRLPRPQMPAASSSRRPATASAVCSRRCCGSFLRASRRRTWRRSRRAPRRSRRRCWAPGPAARRRRSLPAPSCRSGCGCYGACRWVLWTAVPQPGAVGPGLGWLWRRWARRPHH
jgi:hypothetical protein